MRSVLRSAHNRAHGAGRVNDPFVGSLHLFERNDLRSDRKNQIRAVMDAALYVFPMNQR
jgi:hypothetical protein